MMKFGNIDLSDLNDLSNLMFDLRETFEDKVVP